MRMLRVFYLGWLVAGNTCTLLLICFTDAIGPHRVTLWRYDVITQKRSFLLIPLLVNVANAH